MQPQKAGKDSDFNNLKQTGKCTTVHLLTLIGESVKAH